MNKPIEALKAYEENLQARPNRFNSIYGSAIAAKESDEKDKAKMYFEKLIMLSEGIESQRPEIEEANKYLNGKNPF